uniref:ZP domain-containing protein n=1 Tax=Plectus sambesii TaxID=2011161 RepID=A0A914VIP6_9BILA
PRNLQSFETEFLQYIGFGCPGLKLGPNSKPSIRGATDVSCTPNSLTVTIRTQKPMNGLIYAQQYSEDSKCVQVASNEKRETTLTLFEGTCGLQKTPSVNGDGYNWNVTVMLQFHPLVITKVDQGLDINCFTPARVSQAEIGRSTI